VRVLIDTQALLWWMNDSPRLGRAAHAVIADPSTPVWISAVVAWEIVIKVMTGRLALKEPPEICIPREMERQGFQALSISTAHALAVRSLPKHHRDPFDRMLVAQATAEGLTVVTTDPMFRRYDVSVLDASV
jgi:PIN domain nuclease of toxin-antitoxin system